MSQYASRWLTEREGGAFIFPLNVKVVVARRASAEEWSGRDPKTAHIPRGVIVVEVENRMIPEHLSLSDIAALDVQTLVEGGLATAYLVEGHARTDSRPLCRLIGGDSIIADLPLLPILLANPIAES